MRIKQVLTVLAVWFFGAHGHAVVESVTATVQETLLADDDRWGGCMVKLDVTLASEGLDCLNRWVSFSCNGVYTTEDIAYRMFESAQLAHALGRSIRLLVDDTKKHNGYCYANRIDVLP